MTPLNKLFARNKGKGSFRAEHAGDEATIYFYDAIVDDEDEAEWCGGVSPVGFAAALATTTAPVIHLRVNSPGGSVFGARAMEQLIREHPSKFVAHVDGVAASAASFLIMAADEIVMAPGAMIMVHKAWTLAMGNSDELLSTAALLEKVDGSLIKTYAARTKAAEDLIEQWLAAETWFDAEEAVEHGFADRVAEASPKAKIAWDLSAYQNAPKPEPEIKPEAPPPEVSPLEAMRRRLDLAARI